MTDCSKTSTILELPECSEIASDSYLLVQSSTDACKVKISNLVMGPENIDFYPELIEILNKLDQITTFLQANSATWDNTATAVATSADTWNTLYDVDLQDVGNVVNNNKAAWSSTAATVQLLSSDWNGAYNQLQSSSGTWDQTATIVSTNQSSWDQAYTASLTVESAAAEAIQVIESAYSSNMLSVYTTVYDNSASWL